MENITQISLGRFHHFHLARQLEKNGLLREIFTGYPKFKLTSEEGVPKHKIKTYPWLQSPYMGITQLNINLPEWLKREWEWYARITLDNYAKKKLSQGGVVIALSGVGLASGTWIKQQGGKFFCDRGSSHIRFQNQLLIEECAKWSIPFSGIDPKIIDREEAEYEMADFIVVPSNFARSSFLKMGYPENKIFLNPYGARLDRFYKVCEPDKDCFEIIFVGHVGVQKGFIYLMEAFKQLSHPNKKLKVIGSIDLRISDIISKYDVSNISFLGNVPNKELLKHYSSAHVMVLPSIQEGLAMVIGEALACGCPVIATDNTGACDLYEDGLEGFIIEPRNVTLLVDKLEQLIQDGYLRQKMSAAAQKCVASIGGWDSYGDRWAKKLT